MITHVWVRGKWVKFTNDPGPAASPASDPGPATNPWDDFPEPDGARRRAPRLNRRPAEDSTGQAAVAKIPGEWE